MAEPAIDIRQLSKVYRLGESSGYRTLRETLASAVRGRRPVNGSDHEIRALDDLNLTVEQGQALGVIGRNGAGKTTLLKILARITEPTSGVARTRGRVGALLEVGTGFHPELTGRENVYLNGSVLGMSRGDIRRRFDEIASFSGLERFLDTPLKRYSAGMRVRLAFAIAAHLETEIAVVDEILAAGDAEFQRKCLGKMSEFGRRGRTVVFVSHDLGAVTRLCPRAVWLDQGSIVEDGAADRVVEAYLRSGAESARAEFPVDRSRPVQLRSVAVTDAEARAVVSPRRDQQLFLRFLIQVRERIPGLDLVFYLVNRNGVGVLEDGWSDTRAPGENIDAPGAYEASVRLPDILAAGEYMIRVRIGTPHEDFLDEEVLRFRLEPRPNERAEELERVRVVAPWVQWEVKAVSPTPSTDRE
jgi:ABC-2 type transport system ATP-binding protein/lipopolysaccharide transport system ATP-binding protein